MKQTVFVKSIVFFILFFSVITIYGVENNQALAIAEFERGNYFVKCNDYIYFKEMMNGDAHLVQLISDPKKYSSALKERTLSESDKLNGLSYKGEYKFWYTGPMRICIRENVWTEWQEGGPIISIEISNTKGIWSSRLLSTDPLWGEIYKRFTCFSLSYSFPAMFPSAEDRLIQAKDFIIIAEDSMSKRLPEGITGQYLKTARAFVNLASRDAKLNSFMEGIQKNRIIQAEFAIDRTIHDYEAGSDISRQIEQAKNIIIDFLLKKKGPQDGPRQNPSQPTKPTVNIENNPIIAPSRPSSEPTRIYSEADLISALKNADYIITGGKNYTIRWITFPNATDRRKILEKINNAKEALNSAAEIAKNLSNEEALSVISQCEGALDIDLNDFNRGGGGKRGLRDAQRIIRDYLKGK